MKLCPRCRVELAAEFIEGVTVDGCPECGGVWFDEKELTQAAQAHRGALLEMEDHFAPHGRRRSPRAARGGQCPNCGEPLLTFELKHSRGILLDGCRTCKGIWVDDGELRAIWKKIQAQQKRGQDPERPAKPSRAAALTAFLTKVHCPVCNEANPATALVCWRCQAVLKGRRGAMLCPHCNGRLVSQDWGELTLDRCQACGGLWMSDQTLAHLLAQDAPPNPSPFSAAEQERFALLEVSPASPPPPPAAPRLCPVCHQPLSQYEYAYSSGVHLNKCSSCQGVWLDGRQWDALTRFLARRRA